MARLRTTVTYLEMGSPSELAGEEGLARRRVLRVARRFSTRDLRDVTRGVGRAGVLGDGDEPGEHGDPPPSER